MQCRQQWTTCNRSWVIMKLIRCFAVFSALLHPRYITSIGIPRDNIEKASVLVPDSSRFLGTSLLKLDETYPVQKFAVGSADPVNPTLTDFNTSGNWLVKQSVCFDFTLDSGAIGCYSAEEAIRGYEYETFLVFDISSAKLDASESPNLELKFGKGGTYEPYQIMAAYLVKPEFLSDPEGSYKFMTKNLENRATFFLSQLGEDTWKANPLTASCSWEANSSTVNLCKWLMASSPSGGYSFHWCFNMCLSTGDQFCKYTPESEKSGCIKERMESTNLRKCFSGRDKPACETTECVPGVVCEEGYDEAICRCPSGQYGDGKASGTGCHDSLCDIPNLNDCVADSTCTDGGPDGYTCTCNPGYEGDGRTACNEKEFCKDPAENDCVSNAECTELPAPDTFDCVCQKGFIGDGHRTSSGGTGCVVERFCDDDAKNDCSLEANCTEDGPVGTYVCSCPSGYIGDGHHITSGGTGCSVKNYCTDRADNDCDTNATCIEEGPTGTYQCRCDAGYFGDGHRSGAGCSVELFCVVPAKNDCADRAICTELGPSGTFGCSCESGYIGDGRRMSVGGTGCEVETFCDDPSKNDCVTDASCTELGPSGTFNCACLKGYTGDGKDPTHGGSGCNVTLYCGDASKNDCNTNATCIEEGPAGTFTCSCNKGYVGDGRDSGNGCEVELFCNAPEKNDCDENALCAEHGPSGTYECSCKSGYIGDGRKHSAGGTGCEVETFCDDRSKNDCVKDASCTELGPSGTYSCACLAGYTGDGHDPTKGGSGCAVMRYCDDTTMNECESNAKCIEEGPTGTFSCVCHSGYVGDGRKSGTGCEVELFCNAPEKNDCADNAICAELGPSGAFECSCNSGYVGDGRKLSTGGTGCEVEKFCDDPSKNDCVMDASCTELGPSGTYSCACLAGYTGDGHDPTKGGSGCAVQFYCNDATMNDCDSNAICNEEGPTGTFSCTCQSGYVGDGRTSGMGCEVELFCNAPEKNDCADNAICAELGPSGAFECSCNSGYVGDGRKLSTGGTGCEVEKFCDDPSKNDCVMDASCTELGPSGTYSCACLAGYTGDGHDPTKGGSGCFVKLYCDDPKMNDCHSNATCNEEGPSGTFSCTCHKGYFGDGRESGTGCEVERFCDDPSKNVCVTDANCTELGPSDTYSCTCSIGYTGDGRDPAIGGSGCSVTLYCDDPRANDCDSEATCNEEGPTGTFSCTCPKGYVGDGKMSGSRCEVELFCNDPLKNDCVTGGSCAELGPSGTYSCTCATGYNGDGHDPATGGSGCSVTLYCGDPAANDCDSNATCKEEGPTGTFSCTCNTGYVGDGLKYGTGCKVELFCDAPEKNDCDENSKCAELPPPGTFECSCNSGYVGDGHKTAGGPGCTVKKYCEASDTNDCDTNATCVELGPSGTYDCICNSGYEGDGIKGSSGCTIKTYCDDPSYSKNCDINSTCTELGPSGTFGCICNSGYIGSGLTSIDGGCKVRTYCDNPTANDCAENSKCEEQGPTGTFECTCKEGYEGDGHESGTKCTVIKFCDDPTKNDCMELATCVEENGLSFSCTCPEGYDGDGHLSSLSCVPFKCDPDDPNWCTKDSTCMMNEDEGFPVCECNEGFSGDGRPLREPCTEDAFIASVDGARTNLGLYIGILVGFVLLLIGLVAIFWFYCFKRKPLREAEEAVNIGIRPTFVTVEDVDPYQDEQFVDDLDEHFSMMD